ncbi:hypothetical protein AMS68_002164 [Peltaster fructicola]|uniref:NmrA-like domain-containing protein n=1 Tax=Peltaster fructicola TaxID=286661 RepID=A0A6H0XPF7_9PEZI|nr:hypothetical protein AMS68_002164 [Peltaster fructicola]
MSLQLLPLEEEDMPVVAKLINLAFTDDGLMNALYPEGFGQAQHEWYASKLLRDFHHSKGTRFKKIVDTSLPDDHPDHRIISVAKWSFHATPRTEAELDAEDKDDEDGMGAAPGVNQEVMDAFHGEIARNRRRVWGGKPYVILHLLATHPSHHRRGSGARQLEWGLAAADQLNLPVWLEASTVGKPLYERAGFKSIDHVEFDAVRYGLAEDFITTNMLRPAVKPSKVSVLDLSTVLVLGAGELGVSMLNALAAHPAVQEGRTKVAVLLRPGSKSIGAVKQISSSFAILTEDIATASIDTLADHFKLFDGIISCTGFAGGAGTQRKIADAVSVAGRAAPGRKRFMPWQYGVDYDVFGRGGRMELWDEQLDVRDRLRSSSWPDNVKWTIVSTGIFTSFIFEEDFGVVKGLKGAGDTVTVDAIGGMNNKVTATSVEDIGKITVNVLFDGGTLNQVVYTAGQTISYKELAETVRAFGKAKRFQVNEKNVTTLLEELDEDPENAYKKYRVVFAEGRGVSWSPAKTYNVQHSIETEDVRNWLTRNLTTA